MEEKKYYNQSCQDDELTKKFREFHEKIVNEVVKFCKENNIKIDEVYMGIFDIQPSIDEGQWMHYTDSYLHFDTREETGESEHFLYSM